MEPQDSTDENLLHARNVCFMGTSVLSGSGLGVVVTTGRNTYFGAALSGGRRPAASAYDCHPAHHLLLIRIMLIMAPTVFR